jgi:hypothetical protein
MLGRRQAHRRPEIQVFVRHFEAHRATPAPAYGRHGHVAPARYDSDASARGDAER